MRPTNKVELMLFEEEVHNISTVVITDASFLVIHPPFYLWLRIGPQDISDESAAQRFNRPFDLIYGWDLLNEGTQATMHTENAIRYHSSNGKVSKCACDCFPCFDPDFPFALVIEAIEFVELAWLMVASKQKKVVGVLNLITHQKADTFQRLFSPIDVIPQK